MIYTALTVTHTFTVFALLWLKSAIFLQTVDGQFHIKLVTNIFNLENYKSAFQTIALTLNSLVDLLCVLAWERTAARREGSVTSSEGDVLHKYA
jgi:hypothetical protein